jgi:hypothetical protein
MKKIIVPVIAFLWICFNVTAQEKSNSELKGDKYAFRYAYDDAIKSYKKADVLSTEGQRNLAESYYKMGKNMEAEAEYLKLITSLGKILPEDYYNFAMVLKSNAKYLEADKWMDKFVELKPNDLRAKDYLANKNKLSNLLKDNGEYKIIHQNTNTNAEDFGTFYYKNSIVFASSRSNKMFPRKYNWTGKPFCNMYISEVDDGQMKSPESFDKKLNGNLHDGPASFSKYGDFMVFTRNNYKDKTDDKIVELQLWFSSNIDGKWSKPEAFAYNNSEYSVGQPCLTSDGKTMYFTSDMLGGFGGADIYMSKNNGNGQWSKPENMGSKVNTEGDEMFPFYEESISMFYFTSNGRYGLGGLDIFSCIYKGMEIDEAKNAGYPLNTQYDDFAAIVNDSRTKGYISSNRPGGSGGDDIYAFDLLKWSPPADIEVMFAVNAPSNIPVERRVRETFPVRNYVFFDAGSVTIPDRYVLLNKEQVKDFKEDQLEVFTPKKLSGRSDRQMIVYYNVLNILGDRMQKNPETIVRLAGASMEGIPDGLAMAESVKLYLVTVFGINSKRITTEGRIKPRIPSEQEGGNLELDLLREGDRRVSIWSTSPAILMEFQSGPDAPLKPVEIVGSQTAPLESYATFNAIGSDKIFSSWSMEIKDKNDSIQYFGPFTKEMISIPGKTILGKISEGDFKVTMIGTTKSNFTVIKDTTVHLVLWTPNKNEEMMRFSIIYEFNDSKSITIYDKYLTEIVTPKIPMGATVIVHGYTDIIGDEVYNHKLSISRANDVSSIIKNALAKTNRKDVKIEVYGFGEDLSLSPFANKYPEERFYNRTVIIDIIPKK